MDTPDLIPVSLEAAQLTDTWVRDMGPILEAAGIPASDFSLLIYALHSIAHVCSGMAEPSVVMGALEEASNWFAGCEDDWYQTEFMTIIKRVFLPPKQ